MGNPKLYLILSIAAVILSWLSYFTELSAFSLTLSILVLVLTNKELKNAGGAVYAARISKSKNGQTVIYYWNSDFVANHYLSTNHISCNYNGLFELVRMRVF